MKELESRIEKIEERNKRVENDKAWETSTLRKILIIIFTYIFAVLYLKIADTTNPWFGAVVPCVGFYLSTQSIKIVKTWWINKKNKKTKAKSFCFFVVIWRIDLHKKLKHYNIRNIQLKKGWFCESI